MSAIVVHFDEVRKFWTVDFCHNRKVESFMVGVGFPTKEEAVALAEHINAAAVKILVRPTIADLEAAITSTRQLLTPDPSPLAPGEIL